MAGTSLLASMGARNCDHSGVMVLCVAEQEDVIDDGGATGRRAEPGRRIDARDAIGLGQAQLSCRRTPGRRKALRRATCIVPECPEGPRHTGQPCGSSVLDRWPVDRLCTSDAVPMWPPPCWDATGWRSWGRRKRNRHWCWWRPDSPGNRASRPVTRRTEPTPRTVSDRRALVGAGLPGGAVRSAAPESVWPSRTRPGGRSSP